MSVIDEIAAECDRQVEVEGWTAEHDDAHGGGVLARAGVAYAAHAAVGLEATALDVPTYCDFDPPKYWPWQRQWWKPKNPRRDLVRAAALLVKEIERLDRRALTPKEGA